MANVVALPSRGYNGCVVEILETLLERARAGEIVSIMAVFERRGGVFEGNWSGCDELFGQLGYVTHMQYVIQKRIMDAGGASDP